MTDLPTDRRFAGSIPQLYERHLVPLSRALCVDLAARGRAGEVLELAAGTGVLTRELARTLPTDTRLVATDINAPMLAEGRPLPAARGRWWRRRPTLALPFADAAFDAVVCQFGAMFFADRPRAYAERGAMLRPGGRLLFNVWDRLDTNVFADLVTQALAARFLADPPTLRASSAATTTRAGIAEDLRRGGFARQHHSAPASTFPSRARIGRCGGVRFHCHGTPLRHRSRPTVRRAGPPPRPRRIAPGACGDGAVERRHDLGDRGAARLRPRAARPPV